MPIALEGDATARAAVEQILRQHPELAIPGERTVYSMRVVEPDPGIDYKILRVAPDSTVHYRIRIIDPSTGDELPELSRQLGDALRSKVRKGGAQPSR